MVRVLFVARLRGKRLFDDSKGIALSSARIRFKFLRDEDWMMANYLIREKSEPPTSELS